MKFSLFKQVYYLKKKGKAGNGSCTETSSVTGIMTHILMYITLHKELSHAKSKASEIVNWMAPPDTGFQITSPVVGEPNINTPISATVPKNWQ